MTEPTLCEERWRAIVASYERNHESLKSNNPGCEEDIDLLGQGLRTIGRLIHASPSINGNGAVWTQLLSKSEDERSVLCRHLDGKALFTGLLRLYATTHRELRESLLPEPSESIEEFREQRRRKRNPSEEQTKKLKPSPSPRDPRVKSQAEVTTKNFYAPLRTSAMDVAEETSDKPGEGQPSANKSGRPPPIVLTSATNLIQLQRKIKGIVSGDFEFRNTRSGTRIVMKEMADFLLTRKFLEASKLPHFTFFPKAEKPIKAVIRHLPPNTPAEDISEGLTTLGFDVVSVKQMTSTRGSPSEERTVRNLPLFLITLSRSDKSQEIFRLTNLCHIAIRVEAYRGQNGLTQCHNCQQFGHVWANCKQPPRCLWCGGGHLHKECPEKGNSASTPVCCNCRLAEGEKPHPANYRGCKHAREEQQKRKARRTPTTTAGRVFSSTTVTPGVSFAAALRGATAEQQQRPQESRVPVAPPTTRRQTAPAPALQKETGQSIQAPHASSPSLDNMLRVVTIVQQIMTEVSGAVTEDEKVLAITKIVLKLMKQDGH